MKGQDITYLEPTTIEYGNITIRVHHPDLSDEERQRREGQIIAVMQQMGKEMIKKEGRKHGC